MRDLGHKSPKLKFGYPYVSFLHENAHKNLTFDVCSLRDRRSILPLSYTPWKDVGISEQDCSRLFVFYGSLTIDGEQFIGNFTYYPAPIFDSKYVFNNGRVYLYGEAYGPHPDELIQILQSLRVLNGKEVESLKQLKGLGFLRLGLFFLVLWIFHHLHVLLASRV
jgi:hypothetical protein